MNAYCVYCEGPCNESCKKDERGENYCEDCDGPCDGACRKGRPLTTVSQQVDMEVKRLLSQNDEFLEKFYETFCKAYDERMFFEFARSRGVAVNGRAQLPHAPSSVQIPQPLQDTSKEAGGK